jgi:hypothetical protein
VTRGYLGGVMPRLEPPQRAMLERLRSLLVEDIEQAVSRAEVIRLQQRFELVDRVLIYDAKS